MADNKTPLKIDKPIRLIELFAGVGSQAKALQRLGANFEHYKISEWEVNATASYKAIHKENDNTDYSAEFTSEQLNEILFNIGISTDGKKPMTLKEISRKNEDWKRTVYNNFKATNNIGSILNVSGADLGVVDTDKYTYICCYSFPCQDLSLAGKGKGMAKGDNTRSGLLWEVERLLNECTELPQILLMENVTQVHGKKNKEHFDEWCEFLESKGYSNYWKDLNAKNFGIPQNRNRTFMVSVLGDYTYEFPEEFPLELRLKDMLEESVDEKFYLTTKQLNYAIDLNNSQKGTKWEGRCDNGKLNPCIAMTLGVRSAGGGQRIGVSNFVVDNIGEEISVKQFKDSLSPRVISGIGEKKSNGNTQWYQQDRIYDNNVAISVTTAFNPYYKVDEPYIVASRGRNPENPSDRSAGIPTEQRLEPNFSGCNNTLTTVQKDNYVAEPLALDEQNGYVRKDGIVGTLTTNGSSPKHNNRVIEPVRLGYIPYPNSNKAHQSNTFYDENAISPTLDTCEGGNRQVKIQQTNFRIRKLTPKECWRLMGFDDADFEKAEKVNSNTQLYKQAGNSIVVDVLYYIFRKML